MARLSSHPEPFACILEGGGLKAYCPDGVTLIKRPSVGWKVYTRKKAGVDLAAWRQIKEGKLVRLRVMEPWRFKTVRLPTEASLNKWIEAGRCPTPTGHVVELDGTGPDGSPSWVRFFGLI